MAPKVSVIVPVYNVEKYLPQCMDSLINQTLQDIEIICVNDCSPDNSLSILQNYARKDTRIKIIDLKENGGSGHARNMALKEVTGEYVMYLDSDDWLELNACEHAYNQIKLNGNDFAFFNYYTYYEETGKKYCNRNKFKSLMSAKDLNHINLNALSEPVVISSEAWFKIYDVNFIKNNNLKFLEDCFFEDQPFYFRAFISSNNVSVINEPLLYYRKRKGSVTTSPKYWQDSITAWAYTKSFYTPDISTSAKQSFMVNSLNSQLGRFNSYTKAEKSIRKTFYNSLREQLLTYDIAEVEKVKNYIDYGAFAHIIKYTEYEDFKRYQSLKKICHVEQKNNKLIFWLLGLKLGIPTDQNPLQNSFIHMHKIIDRWKIKPNRIVFVQGQKGYCCNLKYIADKIIEKKLPYNIVWLFNCKDKTIDKSEFPSKIKVVKCNRFNAFRYIMTASVIIANKRLPYIKHGLKKSQNQLYIQTWHGSVAFKKIEADIVHNEKILNYLQHAKIDSSYINYLLTPSRFDTEKFSTNFFYNGPILEIGYPRNDIFFYSEDKKREIINKVRKTFNIAEDQKIVIYAPTFRDSKDVNLYKLDSQKICSALAERFGSQWVFMARLHPNMLSQKDGLSHIFPQAINVSSYSDMQELLLASDVFISDYTSSVWDFVLQKKPAFVYATDIEAYTYERDFYIPLEKMPFPITTNEAELVNCITSFDDKSYQKTLADFQQFRGIVDDGKASERTVEIIKKHIEEAQ